MGPTNLILTISLFVAPICHGLDLNPQKAKHITFDDIPETTYKSQGEILECSVAASSSALIYSFDQPREVKSLSFQWNSQGELKIRDSKTLMSKKGDDSYLRIGLLLAGKAPTIPFFAPGWIKAIRDSLKHPTDTLYYLMVGSSAKDGTEWESPYSDSIINYALASSEAAEGWKTSVYKPKKATKLVGLWIMADGDNTASKFTTRVRNLTLE